jgi:hypothetical protein
MRAFPERVFFIEAGVDIVPTLWVNNRLQELGESWRIEKVHVVTKCHRCQARPKKELILARVGILPST